MILIGGNFGVVVVLKVETLSTIEVRVLRFSIIAVFLPRQLTCNKKDELCYILAKWRLQKIGADACC